MSEMTTEDLAAYQTEQQAWAEFRTAKSRGDDAAASSIYDRIEAARRAAEQAAQAESDAEALARLRAENARLRTEIAEAEATRDKADAKIAELRASAMAEHLKEQLDD